MCKRIPMKFLSMFLFIIPMVAGGYAFSNLKQETEIIKASTILVGFVSSVHD